MIVPDASVLVPLVADDEHAGRQARARLRAEELVAPELVVPEVLSAVRRLASAGRLTAQRAAAGVDLLTRLPIRFERHRPLVQRCWELRDTVTPYDAMYVALAERLDVPLLTADLRLARAAGPRCSIETIG